MTMTPGLVDDSWAGGVVDQLDFQGDSDIQKSDGGIQGCDVSVTVERRRDDTQ